LEPALRARSERRELLLAPQADVGLLRRDLEVAEALEALERGLVQRPQVGLLARVDAVERIAVGLGPRVGLAEVVHEHARVPVPETQLLLEPRDHLAVLQVAPGPE